MMVAITPQTGALTRLAHMRMPAQRPPFPLPQAGAPDADPPTSPATAEAGQSHADPAKPSTGALVTPMPDLSTAALPEPLQAAAVAPSGGTETAALPGLGQKPTAQVAMEPGETDRPAPQSQLSANDPQTSAEHVPSEPARDTAPADRLDARAAASPISAAAADARSVATGPVMTLQSSVGRLHGTPAQAPASVAPSAAPATNSAADDSKQQGSAGQTANGKAGQAFATGSAPSAPPIGPLPASVQPARANVATATQVPLPVGPEHPSPPSAGPDAVTRSALSLSPQESAPEVVIGLVDGDRLDVRILASSEDSFDRLSGAESELHAALAAIGTDVEAIHVELRNDLPPDEPGADRAAADEAAADGARRDGTAFDRGGRGQTGAGDGGLRQGPSARAAETLSMGPAQRRMAPGPGQEGLRAGSARLVDRYA